jgi:hypothetical protein
LKWWPYYNGHYFLNKRTDLKKLFNEHDSEQVMDMIDNLIIENSIYDEQQQGMVSKKRTQLNKDYNRYGRISKAHDDEEPDPAAAFGDGPPEYLELSDDGAAPGLEGIPMMGFT